jgi:hypothetical protein
VTAFLGISVWITLATVMPGLITIAAMYGAFAFVAPAALPVFTTELKGLGDAALIGVAVAIMVLTQAIGILLERVLIKRHGYGPETTDVSIPDGIDPVDMKAKTFPLWPYHEYEGLYLLLAELGEHGDTQGHLQRAVAQFFLTNNTLISLSVGIITTVILVVVSGSRGVLPGLLYAVLLVVCLVVSFNVARIRFVVMAKALWAARRRRVADGK